MARQIARPFLWLLSLVVPVVIAACYGPPGENTPTLQGQARDATTQAGIAGIRVTCLSGGSAIGTAYTDLYGDYNFYVSCDELQFDDVDGATNGGPYTSLTVPVEPGQSVVDADLQG